MFPNQNENENLSKKFKLPPTRGDLETFVKMSTTPVLNLMKESHHSEHKFSKVGIISQKKCFPSSEITLFNWL